MQIEKGNEQKKNTKERRQKCLVIILIHKENRTLTFPKLNVMNTVDYPPKNHFPFLLPIRTQDFLFCVRIYHFLHSHVLQERQEFPSKSEEVTYDHVAALLNGI